MFYNQELQELVQKFSTDLKNGLTDKQAKDNLEKYGPNELKSP